MKISSALVQEALSGCNGKFFGSGTGAFKPYSHRLRSCAGLLANSFSSPGGATSSLGAADLPCKNSKHCVTNPMGPQSSLSPSHSCCPRAEVALRPFAKALSVVTLAVVTGIMMTES